MNRADLAEVLLAHGAKVDQEEDDAGTALQVAAAMGHANLVKLLIAHQADVNHKDHEGHTALMCSVFGAEIKGAPSWMLSSFFHIDEQDDRLTMLGSEHLESARILLQAGADVNAKGGDCGLTPLMIAALGGSAEMAKLLLDHHADVNVEDGEYTALKFAEIFDSPSELAKELSNQDSDEDKQALLNWLRFTAPGHNTVAGMLRKAGATH